MRQKIDLTGIWLFQPSLFEEGMKEKFFQNEYNTDHWLTVSVPSSFDDCLHGQRFEESPAWYKRQFFVPESWCGKRVAIHFEGVNFHTKVWVNGELAGENADGFLPFDLLVSDKVKYGEIITMVVYVDNYRLPGDIPGKQLGWRSFGGNLREVEVVSTDLCYVERAGVHAIPKDQRAGNLNLKISLSNEGASADGFSLSIEIREQDGKIKKLLYADVSVPASGNKEVTLDAEIENIEPWCPDNPALYVCHILLKKGDCAIDAKEVRFGFRSIGTRGEKLVLNGQEIFLTGFNRHEDSYRTGMCPDIQLVRQDLKCMKQMGANVVRLCHYQHHPRELDLCDEIGLLVMDELPLYWSEENPDDNRKGLRLRNGNLIQLAKKMDPSRLAVYVLNTWEGHMWDPSGGENRYFEHAEVICINSYPCDKNVVNIPELRQFLHMEFSPEIGGPKPIIHIFNICLRKNKRTFPETDKEAKK